MKTNATVGGGAPHRVTDHGAVGDGVTKCTEAINAAVRAVAESGGGAVVFPAGTYLSGTVRLRSRVTLDLRPGAVLLASPDIADFPEHPPDDAISRHLTRGGPTRHFILAVDSEGVGLRGPGVIDGNVEAYHGPASERKPYTWTGSRGPRYRPMVEFLHCRDVRVEGVTLRNSPGWTCHFASCDGVSVRDARLFNYLYSGNSDGLDIDGCRDVIITGCHIETGDDAIVLKTCHGSRSCERVVVANCLLRSNCAAFKIGTETWHDVRHVAVSNCVVHRSSRAVQIFSQDGATVEDIAVSNLVVDTDCGITLNRPLHLDLCRRRCNKIVGFDHDARPVGRIRRVAIQNVTLNTDGRILLTGGDGGRLEQIHLSQIAMRMPWIEDPESVKDLSDSLQSSIAVPEARLARAALVAANIDDFDLRGFSVSWPGEGVPADYLPKHERGVLVRDPRKQFHPLPPFHALWLEGIRNGTIDAPGLRASCPGIDAIRREACEDLRIREDQP